MDKKNVLIEQNTDFDKLEQDIGYKFKNRALLYRALTHSSYTNEQKTKGNVAESNERLEFLGDSVLSLIVSEDIFKNYPQMPEGELSRIRAGTVCERALGEYASTFSLGSYLFMGKGEAMTRGRERVSLIADAFEALLAAIYLDGGIEATKTFVMPFITSEIGRIFKSGHTEDYKTMLQQIVQQEKGEILEYALAGMSGPAHDRIFTVQAKLNSNIIGRGEGRTKREAEQNAAFEALKLFGAINSKQ